MKFASPQWLWALFLLPLFYVGILYEEKKRLQKLGKFANRSIWSRLIPEWNPSFRRKKGLVLTLGVGFLMLALARPQFGTHEETVHVSGLDIMVVLDVSNSMETEDVIPTRLKKAKHLIKSLVDRLDGDRIGIVAFAASSYVSCPLTTDLAYVLGTLEILSPNSIQNQGTDVGQALDTALRALDRGAQETVAPNPAGIASRVIVLISDGEDHENEALQVAAKIKESGTRLFVLGIGTEKGGPVPVRDENGAIQGYKRDRAGQSVVSSFHPEFLSKVASEGGGKYWNVSPSEEELAELVQGLGGLDRADFAERSYLVYEERYQIPLFIAFLLFILELSLPSRKVLKVGGVIAVVMGLGGAPLAEAAPGLDSYLENQKGLKAFQEGKLEEAQRNFGAAQARDPSQPEPEFNQGVIYLQQGEVDSAIRSFDKAARGAMDRRDPKLFGKSLYNLGNAFAKKGDVKGAVHSYLQAIRTAQATQDATLEDEARKNLELLFQEIKDKKQKQKDEQKDGKQGQEKEQKQSAENDKNKDDKGSKSKPEEKGAEKKEGEKPKDSASSAGEDSKDQKDKEQAKNSSEKNKRYKQGTQQKFESQKLSPDDANRVMSELVDREKTLQEKLQTRNAKTKPNSKDW
jgi:Ca-activated chloride channel family protein